VDRLARLLVVRLSINVILRRVLRAEESGFGFHTHPMTCTGATQRTSLRMTLPPGCTTGSL
jgi:hypothetical protein